jgi:hypothetical protein
MKKLLSLFAITILLFSCSDIEPIDPSLNPNGNAGSGSGNGTAFFRATVDGQSFQDSNPFSGEDNGVVGIVGMDNNSSIALTLTTTTSGTYAMESVGGVTVGGAYTVTGETNSYVAVDNGTPESGSGTITITFNADNTVSGTFEMVAIRYQFDAAGNPVTDANGDFLTEEVVITNGEFGNIALSGPPTGGTNTAMITLNGAPWNVDAITAIEVPPFSGTPARISFTATNGNNNIGFFIPLSLTPGTYTNIGATDSINGVFNEDINSGFPTTIYNADSGSFVVLTHDTTAKTMTGTFDMIFIPFGGTGTDQTIVGEFSISY